ncbi:hypothetical protein KJ782_05975 [Patescibacteria group bacterium]|nr:hypothetical protein [Patescibacteria group bacterium]
MEKKLLNKISSDYSDNYHSHLFEQYKMYVESAEKISDRRQNANNFFFLTLNTVLISVIGLSFQVKVFDVISWSRLLLAILGILICVIFWFLLRAYKQLNSGKFKVIHEIEQLLPLAIYDYEWNILGEGKDKKKYYPFSHIELLIPWIFGIIYLFLGLAFIM